MGKGESELKERYIKREKKIIYVMKQEPFVMFRRGTTQWLNEIKGKKQHNTIHSTCIM